MANLKLTMALSHYDRHIPFFDGSVRAKGVDLTVLEVGQSEPLKHGSDRHERMLQKGEFDICELSLSSYLMAKSRGMPFTAIPVFPRRVGVVTSANGAALRDVLNVISRRTRTVHILFAAARVQSSFQR